MKTMYRAALMVTAFIFLLPLSARSEIREGSFEVGPFGGYNLFENSQNLKDRPVFGGRFGYNFTRHFGIEGAVDFINSRVDDKTKTGAKEGQYRSPMNGVDLTFYHIDAVYHFMPDGKFNPFVLAGFGGAHYNPKISDHDMAAFNVGVGAKYWVADNIALRVDLKDYMVTEIFQETYHNIEATLGITFAFGGKAKPARVQAEKIEAKPEPQPEPKAQEKVIVIALEDVHFDFDKSTLTKEAQVILKRNIEVLKENPKAEVRIEGYTSASGTEEYNQKLSERRANAVKEYLIKEGIVTPDRLTKIGYGEKYPAEYEATPKDLYSESAKANMRVLFEIIVK